MGKKKSLGHNPLAYSMSRHASFDFIGSQKKDDKTEQHSEYEKENDHNINKITASYYLEEPIVNKIKAMANKREISYSALVNSLLKSSLKES